MKPSLGISAIPLSFLQRSRSALLRRTSLTPSHFHGLNRKNGFPLAFRRAIANHPDPVQSSALSVLPTSVDTSSPEYKSNLDEMNDCIAELSALHARIAEGGPKKNRDKHIARGKMLPREYRFLHLLALFFMR